MTTPPASPRDLVGYGPSPPHPEWPNNARIALNIVVNYEEGAEYTLLNGDNRPETILSEVSPGTPAMGRRDLNMESMYDYGARVGIWRVLRMLAEREVIPTIYAAGLALDLNPRLGEEVAKLGCDIVGHGWRWIDYATIDEGTERKHMQRCVDVIKARTGRKPLGWYSGRPSINTRKLVVENGGFLYDCDAYCDDLPFWTRVGDRAHLVIPHALDTNDSRMARNQDLSDGDRFCAYLRDAFDVLYAEGETTPKMMTVSLHGRLIGHPGRIAGLTRFLDYVRGRDRVWFCRREEIARHWIEMIPLPDLR